MANGSAILQQTHRNRTRIPCRLDAFRRTRFRTSHSLMKRLTIIALCLCIGIAAPVAFTGCGTTGTLAISQQNTDQIILRAEQTAQTARLTFDTFVRLERDNEAALKQVNPAIHTYANYIRTHGLDWVTSLRSATKNFKANRSPQNQANLSTILLTITDAVSQTNSYIAQAKAHQ